MPSSAALPAAARESLCPSSWTPMRASSRLRPPSPATWLYREGVRIPSSEARPESVTASRPFSSAREAAASTTASLPNPVLGDIGRTLSHAFEVRVLERGRVLETVAHGPVHAYVRGPDQRHRYRQRAREDHPRGAHQRGQGVGVERVVDGGADPGPGKVTEHGEVGREQQHPEHQPATPVYPVEQHAQKEQGDALGPQQRGGPQKARHRRPSCLVLPDVSLCFHLLLLPAGRPASFTNTIRL